MGALGRQAFFYVASGAKDLGEALTLFERYFRIVNEAVRLKLVRAPQGVVVEVNFVGLPRHTARQNAEFGIAAILKALREVAGPSIRPTRVEFAHARNSDLRAFEHFYRSPTPDLQVRVMLARAKRRERTAASSSE